MTDLNKTICRVTPASRHEQGKTRQIIVILDPQVGIGVRLKGTRTTYWLGVESVYCAAVRATVEAEKRAKRKVRR